MSHPFVDMHCHPSLKPYGQSFKTKPFGQNSANRRKKNSIWFYDSPNLFERGIQMLGGICKFTQADCTTLAYGNTRIICASLYPIERGFFKNKLGTKLVSDLGVNFITGVSKARVDYVQDVSNYFEDLEREYDYYKQLDGVPVTTDGGVYSYKIVQNYQQVETYLASDDMAANTLFIVLSIEGLHVLQNSYSDTHKADEAAIMKNVAALKKWEHKPFFVTLAHHFYNHLCGHAKSFSGLVANVSDQTFGMDEGFTPIGKKVVKELLNNKDGKRILVDIKHMSATSRQEYFQLLQTDFATENIPVLVSHGAANGLRSAKEPVHDGKDTAQKLLDSDINFYDDEILLVAKTKGVFSLQLDERRIASEATLKNTRHAMFINKIRHYRAELVWNQVQHIAELLDRHDLFAWECMAIGSDYDGIINPLNGFLTAETLQHLQEYLERYVHNYLQGEGKIKLKSYNQISASEIVNRLFSTNAMEFMRKWYV